MEWFVMGTSCAEESKSPYKGFSGNRSDDYTSLIEDSINLSNNFTFSLAMFQNLGTYNR